MLKPCKFNSLSRVLAGESSSVSKFNPPIHAISIMRPRPTLALGITQWHGKLETTTRHSVSETWWNHQTKGTIFHMQMVLWTSPENCLFEYRTTPPCNCFNSGDHPKVVVKNKQILETLHHFQNYHPSMKCWKSWAIPKQTLEFGPTTESLRDFQGRVTMAFPRLGQRIACTSKTSHGTKMKPEIGKGEKKQMLNSHVYQWFFGKKKQTGNLDTGIPFFSVPKKPVPS